MPAHDRVPGPAQILRQIHFHLHRRLEWHRVQVRVEFRQQPDAVTLHNPRIFDSRFVILKAFLRRQSRHAYVHAGLLEVVLSFCFPGISDFANSRIEQDDVNIVVLFRLRLGAKMLEGSTLHVAFTQGFRYSIARSLQPEDGDPFIGGVQFGVASQLWHGFQQGQHRRVEN